MAPAEAQAAGRAVARHLAQAPELDRCDCLLLYAALPDELPTGPLAELGRARGKALLWPRLAAQGGLEFAACSSAELRPGPLRIPTPPATFSGRSARAGDLVLVPGVAFDERGWRLGRGGGHYDRALAGLEGAFRVGVGYEFQRLERVPAEPHDERLDALLTEAGLRRSQSE